MTHSAQSCAVGPHLLSKQAYTSGEVMSLEYWIIPVWEDDEIIKDVKNNKMSAAAHRKLF